jgi:hypothetical protein
MFGLLLLLVPLAVGAYLLVAQLGSNGPTAPAITHAETQGQSAVAGTNLRGADEVLQGWFAEKSTYAGATLPPGSGVVLVRADATSYCLQTATAPVEHEVGPGGQAAAGPCM